MSLETADEQESFKSLRLLEDEPCLIENIKSKSSITLTKIKSRGPNDSEPLIGSGRPCGSEQLSGSLLNDSEHLFSSGQPSGSGRPCGSELLSSSGQLSGSGKPSGSEQLSCSLSNDSEHIFGSGHQTGSEQPSESGHQTGRGTDNGFDETKLGIILKLFYIF